MPNTRNLRHLNLNMCFSNSTPESKSPPMSPIVTATTSSPHHIHHNPPSPSPSIMIKNFNSLYNPTLTMDHSVCSSSLSTTSTSFEPEPEPADFATAFASKRFFFSSPGRSNSLIEYTKTNTSRPAPPGGADGCKKKKKAMFNGSVAVPTYSPDPYLDFRRSMQEMVEARPELMDVKSNWNILHELLLCYLALNPKSNHKFILGAFADLIVSLMSF
ncbi:transcription repressor OFP11-like [Gastrolobium bilobum]|uniref:transcription repressor OFP11-like n=1 Tax=Gastrolobium bilobum TaxID=150636 RepID=UPI002AB017E3|nr:transcription repressor OFP11-like [Gastrolobium bilobum]